MLKDFLPNIHEDIPKKLDQIVEDLSDYANKIDGYERSNEVLNNNQKYSSLRNNIKPTSPDKIQEVFNEVNKYTNIQTNGNYINDMSCIISMQDNWTINKTECGSAIYISPLQDPRDKIGSECCLVFSEWDDIAIDARYLGNCNIAATGKFPVNEGVKFYVNKLKAYEKLNQLLLDHLIESNQDIQRQFNSTYVNIREDILETRDVSSHLLSFIDYYYGNKGLISNYLNCCKYNVSY